MTSNLSPHRQQLSQQRDAMRVELASALEDEADPLAAYDNFVKWTLQNYVNHSESGLLELLEEAVLKFRDDMRYKAGDLRYVKLWILFANHVEKPAPVYAYMLEKGIGKPYALFFEEYAEALEREARFTEAETVMTLGIRTQAKPLKRLQCFQSDYETRRATGKHLPAKVPPFGEGTCPPVINVIRTDPLRNIAPRRAGSILPSTLSFPSTAQHDVSMHMTTTQAIQPTRPTRPNPYAHLNAPAAPGKRPEKLRFDLTLLLDPDGTEYSFEEARARHLGLLGKKWPPPPPPNAAVATSGPVPSTVPSAKERSVKVDFNDQGNKTGKGARRQSVTVTINTKQALEDVFDMYNSPVKENDEAEEVIEAKPRTAEAPGNSHTPASVRPPVFQDENAGVNSKPRAFQPYVDQKRENATPGPLKFKPVTTKTPGANAFTPNVARKALIVKELVTPVPAFKVVRPDQNAITPAMSKLRPLTEERDDKSGIDVFGGDDVTTEEFTEEFTNPAPPPPPPRSFVPFVDENTGSRSLPACDENAPAPTTSKILKFQVHRDENAPPPPLRRSILGEHTPSRTFFQPTPREEHAPVNGEEDPEALDEVADEGDDYEEVDDRQRPAMSGRFGDFDVMTPITERTFEFTVSTRAVDTPGSDRSSMYDKGFVVMDAKDVAEKLAAELQEEEGREREGGTAADVAASSRTPLLGPELLDVRGIDDSASNAAFSSFDDRSSRAPFRLSDGFTIEPNHSNMLSSAILVDRSTTVNLTEVVAARAGFGPSNPCNPSDPAIVSKLLSALPPDPNHRNLQDHVANNLDKLQRFAEKRARRGSGASSSGRVSDGSDKHFLELDGDQFEVYDKLGEGGFGAVFMAKSMNRARRRFEEDDEDDEDEDEDDGLVAIKAVRPTNLWESYVLRRVISAVPDELRRSIIQPHSLYAFKDESFLVLDLCQQGTLLEIVNRATETGVGQPGGGVDELLVMFFAVELLRIVQGLHDRGFIHGDLKIDNCLIRLEDVPGGTSAWSGEYSPASEGGWAYKGIKLIDFGRTIDTKLFPSGQTFVADWKTDARDCVEMREGRPWTFQTDYSGLASIIYCMLFGKYIETVEVAGPGGTRKLKPGQPMKRYWQVDLWNKLFDALLNPCQLRPNGSLPVTDELVALRGALETWIQANCNKGGKNLKGMLKKIEIATLRRTRK